MKFLGGVGDGPGTKGVNFGDDADHHPDPGVQNPDSLDYRKKYLIDSDQSCIAKIIQQFCYAGIRQRSVLLLHCESKKHATILLSISSPNIDRF